MSAEPRNVVILGSTGSIGCNTLDVIAGSSGRFRVLALTAHSRLGRVIEQAREFRPRYVIATSPEAAAVCGPPQLPPGTRWLVGPEAVERVVADPEVDVVVTAMVGSAALAGTIAALAAGKRVALANKEALVMAGPLVTRLARQSKATIIPVDSEHSAIFQCLAAGRRDEVARVVLTASGGPFLRATREQMRQASVEQALSHPTWQMGPKISIDSATMMNKALEIVEARWLFDLPAEKITVAVHPQSVIHSLVEFRDGSIVAQLSPPDMKLPIQLALSYPERWCGEARRLDWSQSLRLDLEPPDYDRFPALRLGHQVATRGGTAGAVLNAANEAAVTAFLEHQIGLTDIAAACEAVLQQHEFEAQPSLQQLVAVDRWARQEVQRWISRN